MESGYINLFQLIKAFCGYYYHLGWSKLDTALQKTAMLTDCQNLIL